MFAIEKENTLTLVAEENFSCTFTDALHTKLQEAMQSVQSQNVVLDLTQVELLDSVGVKLLVGLYKACQEKKLNLRFDVANQNVYKVIKLCKLDQLIEVRETQVVQ